MALPALPLGGVIGMVLKRGTFVVSKLTANIQ